MHRSRYGSVLRRFDLLKTAIQCAPKGGLWLECGVYRGDSINFISNLVADRVYGFDSFEGLPTSWGPQLKAGAYSTAGVVPTVNENVTLIQGWFDATLPLFLGGKPGAPVSFLHVDSDLYSSARTVLSNLRSRIHVGTVIVFDEFCGALPDDEARAFREFVRGTGARFEYLGSALEGNGSVAIRITVSGGAEAPDSPN